MLKHFALSSTPQKPMSVLHIGALALIVFCASLGFSF